MARTDKLTNFCADIANAIRTKKGTTEQIPASSFDTEIGNLPSGDTLKKFVGAINMNSYQPSFNVNFSIPLTAEGSMPNKNNTIKYFSIEPDVTLGEQILDMNRKIFLSYCSYNPNNTTRTVAFITWNIGGQSHIDSTECFSAEIVGENSFRIRNNTSYSNQVYFGPNIRYVVTIYYE